MIEPALGNLLASNAQALVNTVNSVGAMGKGLALEFKKAFPQNNTLYVTACKAGQVKVGEMFIVTLDSAPRRYIINFPTKDHWKNPSKIEYVHNGLVSLIHDVKRLNIESIAIPALGCGLGGLDWKVVRPMIETAFAPLPDVRVFLYGPQ